MYCCSSREEAADGLITELGFPEEGRGHSQKTERGQQGRAKPIYTNRGISWREEMLKHQRSTESIGEGIEKKPGVFSGPGEGTP